MAESTFQPRTHPSESQADAAQRIWSPECFFEHVFLIHGVIVGDDILCLDATPIPFFCQEIKCIIKLSAKNAQGFFACARGDSIVGSITKTRSFWIPFDTLA